MWGFPKLGGTALFWCPYNKDPTRGELLGNEVRGFQGFSMGGALGFCMLITV